MTEGAAQELKGKIMLSEIWSLKDTIGKIVAEHLMKKRNKQVMKEIDELLRRVIQEFPNPSYGEIDLDVFEYQNLIELRGFLSNLEAGISNFLNEKYAITEMTPLDTLRLNLSSVIDQINDVLEVAPVEIVTVEFETDNQDEQADRETSSPKYTYDGLETDENWNWYQWEDTYRRSSFSQDNTTTAAVYYNSRKESEDGAISWDEIPE